jgi:hypothetical protein
MPPRIDNVSYEDALREMRARLTRAQELIDGTSATADAYARTTTIRVTRNRPAQVSHSAADADAPENAGLDEGNDPAPADCTCETCKAKRWEPSGIRYGRVEGYAFQPAGGWKLRKVKGEQTSLYMGVELETSRVGWDFSNEQAVSMRRPARFWVAKRDGSVSGPEFASHPASLSWWSSHQREMAEMFKMLVHAGFRSHDNGKAGMHVNISKSAFDGGGHLARFLTLVNYSKRWSLLMSQRTASQVNQWANFMEGYSSAEAQEEEILRVSEDAFGIWPSYWNKYTAVHVPARQERVEFRLPRGTLRPDRFFKNLEWTAAMIEATETESITPRVFMSWAEQDGSDRYDNLRNFIIEKADVLKVAAAERTY